MIGAQNFYLSVKFSEQVNKLFTTLELSGTESYFIHYPKYLKIAKYI